MARGRSPQQLAAWDAKVKTFAAEYLADFDATRAGAVVGLTPQSASRFLWRDAVRDELARQTAAKLAAANLSGTRTLSELGSVAFSNIQHLLDADGNLIPIHQLPPHVAASIASIEWITKNAKAGDRIIDTILKVRLWPKVPALEVLAKHYGILVEHVEHHADAELADLLRAGRQRLDQARGELQAAIDSTAITVQAGEVQARPQSDRAQPETVPKPNKSEQKRTAKRQILDAEHSARLAAARSRVKPLPQKGTPAPRRPRKATQVHAPEPLDSFD